MQHHVTCLAAITLTSGLALGGDGSTTDQQVAELTEMVSQLQGEIAALQAANDDTWLTEARAEEVRGLVQDVLADADTRASLLQSGVTAGYDKGFMIGSSDGAFKLVMNGQIQVRYVYNNQDNSPGATGDDNRDGFEIRRAKLKFKGHVIDDTWGYVLNGAYDRNGGEFILEDAVISKKFGGGWKMYAGQFKAPFMREELVSSTRQQAVDRSLVNERFNRDRSQGIALEYKGDQLKLTGMFHDGFNTDNTGWQQYTTEFAFTGRAEFLFSGEWNQFKYISAMPGSETGFLIGGAFHYEQQEFGTDLPSPKEDAWLVTFDASLQMDNGLSVFAAFVYADITSSNPWGFNVQAGYFLNDDWEVYARYEYGDNDDDSDELSVITAGVNRYWAKGKVKWTTDLGFGINAVTSAWDSTGVGWRTDAPDEDGQFVFRSQLQLLF